ncbi:MAG TPA: glycosyltransferase [Pyrinomonadaceae bacterium]|nr:glycosyltransferase [Pyrinomonadaceae bacterium]
MAARLSSDYNIQIAYRSRRKILSILNAFVFLVRVHPLAIYVFDISYTGVLASCLYRFMFRNCLIVETGDAIVELVRSTGNRGRVGLWLTRLLEKTAFGLADRIVVRGSFHKELLSGQGIESDVIQDGVDTDNFMAGDVTALRKQYGLEEVLTVGLVGSSIWSEKLQMCYGWELVETLRLLKGKPVKGIMIGGGSGIPHLKARCREYGIEEEIIFLGQVPYEQLPRYLQLIDICLSTQTNDLVGRVRTTGKLPLYLAAGRYILATDVGEAALVLDKEMLVEYEGVKDEGYPQKLKERIEIILEHPGMLERSTHNVAVARENFDYSILAERMEKVIETTVKRQRSRCNEKE